MLLNAREALAQLINAPQSEDIAFCCNCTDALNLAIKGSLRVGDHVIASALEHNSVLRVLEGLRSRGLITFTVVFPEANGAVNPDDYLNALRPETHLCILTHASNVTGAIQPVAAIGRIMHSRGIRYLIDGAQAIGHIPVDVQMLGCDLYAFPGHKGLLGPQGTGGLYIAPEIPLEPVREGGTGSSSDSMLQPSERPDCFESGTSNLPGISGLKAGAELVASQSNSILDSERELTSALWNGLKKIPGITLYTPQESFSRVGVVSFNIGSQFSSSEVADRLAAQNIAVRGGLHCAPIAHQWLGTTKRGAVRASISWQNSMDDIELFLRAVFELAHVK